MGAELVQVIGYPVIKACAHGKNDIRMMHGGIGLVGAMHTQHTQILTISARVATQSHQRIGHRIIQLLRQRYQMLGCIVDNNAASGINNRALSFNKGLYCAFNLTAMSLVSGLIGAYLDLAGPVIGNLVTGVSNIFGNIHNHRARPTRSRNIVGLGDGLGDIFSASH